MKVEYLIYTNIVGECQINLTSVFETRLQALDKTPVDSVKFKCVRVFLLYY